MEDSEAATRLSSVALDFTVRLSRLSCGAFSNPQFGLVWCADHTLSDVIPNRAVFQAEGGISREAFRMTLRKKHVAPDAFVRAILKSTASRRMRPQLRDPSKED